MTDHVLVTGREAAAMLASVLPVREHARLVLRAGFAGDPYETSGALLYDRARVAHLARRPFVTAEEVEAGCPHGLYVARLPRTARVDVRAHWRELAERVATQPPMPTMTAALVSARMRAFAPFPWVATLCGYVVLAAETSGMRGGPQRTIVFDLAEPGPWSRTFVGRPLRTRPGRPWVLLEPGRTHIRSTT